MNKIFFTLFALFFLTLISSQAALYKGQRIYSKVCMKCHTGGGAFIGNKTQYEWDTFTRSNGKKLLDVHLNSDKFKNEEKYKKYFLSKKYKTNNKHLGEFLMEYAKDSGNVPACN
jgi:cytochrome c1